MAMPISVSQSAPKTSFICHRIHSHCVHYFILIHAAFMCPNEVGYGSICIPLALVFHNSMSTIAFQQSPVDICAMVGRIQQKSSRMGWKKILFCCIQQHRRETAACILEWRTNKKIFFFYVGCPNAQVNQTFFFPSRDILVSPRFHPVEISTSHHRNVLRLPQNIDSKLCRSALTPDLIIGPQYWNHGLWIYAFSNQFNDSV